MVGTYLKRGAAQTLPFAFIQIITKLLTMGVTIAFLNRFDAEALGVWDAYQLFFTNMLIIMSSAATQSLIRFYPLFISNQITQKAVVANAFLITTIICSFCVLVHVTTAIFFKSSLTLFSYIILFSGCLAAYGAVTITFMRTAGKLINSYIWSSLQNIGLAVLCWYSVIKNYGISGFFYAQLAMQFILLPTIIKTVQTHPHANKKILWEQLKYAAPLVFFTILYALFFTIDRIALAKWHGMHVLGQFGILARCGTIFQVGSIALSEAWPYLIFNAHQENNNDPKLLDTLTHIYLMVLVCGASAALSISIYLMRYGFEPRYQQLILYLPLFFTQLFLVELPRITHVGAVLSRQTQNIVVTTSIALFLQAIFLFLLVPSCGIAGTCFANCATFICHAILNRISAHKMHLPIGFSDFFLIRIIHVWCINALCITGLIIFQQTAMAFVFGPFFCIFCCWFSLELEDKQLLKSWILHQSKQLYTQFCITFLRIQP